MKIFNEKWVIKDWMGNDFVPDGGKKEYESFDDARDAITVFANWLTDKAIENGKYKSGSPEHEEAIQGIEEDLYAIHVDENGKEIKD